jgi:integrase
MAKSQRSENWARESAPTRREFKKMLDGIEQDMTGEIAIQCKFILYSIGELGLRAAEVVHMKKDWVDLHKNLIDIPEWEYCECGYCKQQAEQAANKNTDVTYEEAIRDRWKPEQPSAIREVPFGYNQDIVELYKLFFDFYEEYPRSRSSINRRVDRIVEASGIGRDKSSINPQTLRSAAATYHADNGMHPESLADFMGWASAETALKHMRRSSNGLQNELNRIHNGD